MKSQVKKLAVALFAAAVLVVGGVALRAQAPLAGSSTQVHLAGIPGETQATGIQATGALPTATSASRSQSSAASQSSSGSTAQNSPASSAPSSATSAKAPTKQPTKQQTAAAKDSGMVWVNTETGVYHKPGTRWYGKTKKGKYMLEADAIKAGYKAAK